MEELNVLLLIFILVCAVSVSLTKNLLSAVIIFMAQSLAMSVVWILLESPDLGVTEAAVGAGVTSLLMFAALKKIHRMRDEKHEKKQ
ncbi:MAG: DUF4040 domain-containing protein [Clostridia bacterium]|nr:DUF4040 domain-containing protein [Clostridia bacterium]MBQ3231442.1 DUF4040 domain-containing protein [Clostridia bacterium]MBQ4619552.1 DUF4040 domain-containing protein [Clostridia bacterium]MBQ9856760.1 DUF4040 domain-containing protein [Clostridia bacterium]